LNRQEVKQMILVINNEMEQNEERIGDIITRNQQLELAKLNLEGWLTDNKTSVGHVSSKDPMLEPIPTAADIKPKRRLSKSLRNKISKAQKERWAKFKALGTLPLPKDEPAKPKKSGGSSYWSRFTPEQRKKEMKRRRALGQRRANRKADRRQ